jgi:hypothetical protein
MITTISMEEFKAFQGVSYSRLSNLANGPQAYKAGLEDDPSSSALSLGSAVDIMLTEPDKFDEQIYVMSAQKPGSEMMLAFVEEYVKTDNSTTAWKASGFKMPEAGVLKKFATEGKNYYDALKIAGERKIMDVEDMFKANQLVKQLKENPFTKKYFVPEDGVELMFQVPITWSFTIHELDSTKTKSIPAKSILDAIRIDHKNKTIQPIELKTGAEHFFKGFWRYRRYLQGSMYHDAVLSLFWQHEPIAEEYEIKNIKFVFVDTNMILPPMIYNMTNDDIYHGREGRRVSKMVSESATLDCYNPLHTKNRMFKTKGYVRLTQELDWHKRINQWDYTYDQYQNNGEVDIDAFIVKL